MIRSLNQKAFTLIELMVTIALIALLSVMVVIGIGKLQTNSKRQQTMLTLENLRAMYADYDSVARLHFPNTSLPCPQNVTLDANPASDSAAVTQANDTGSANRYGAAVWATRDIMSLLRQTPSNAAALGKLAPGAVMRMPLEYNGYLPAPYCTPQAAPNPWAAAWSAVPQYVALSYANDPMNTTSSSVCSIAVTDPITQNQSYAYFRCILTNTGNSPPNTAFWMPICVDDTVPILLDGWGNPIIFVSGGSLANFYSLVNNPTVVPGSGLLLAGNRVFTVNSPDGRPFFASAGPDGDFSKGDDNLYSFEK